MAKRIFTAISVLTVIRVFVTAYATVGLLRNSIYTRRIKNTFCFEKESKELHSIGKKSIFTLKKINVIIILSIKCGSEKYKEKEKIMETPVRKKYEAYFDVGQWRKELKETAEKTGNDFISI